jgi:predicted XRE-type DNA-binding protein
MSKPKGDQQQDVEFTISSGNVFADLGLPEPEVELVKAKLVHAIADVIAEQSLTQAQAAVRMGLKQPHVSVLLRGRTEEFSVGRLITLLNRIGKDVVIAVQEKPASRPHGRTFVGSAEGKALPAAEITPVPYQQRVAAERSVDVAARSGRSGWTATKVAAKKGGLKTAAKTGGLKVTAKKIGGVTRVSVSKRSRVSARGGRGPAGRRSGDGPSSTR